MKPQSIHTDNAPAAIGPYSQAIRAGNLLFTSGQIALDPKTGEFLGGGDIEEETERVLKSLEAILVAGGVTLQDVVKTTVYLADLSHFAAMNRVYEKFFSGTRPARACIQAAQLPKGAQVEIDAIAIVTP
jgi:2-iminobutanoate/2-iminopropanoate deaminase